MNLEQAKRLKEAEYPMNEVIKDEFEVPTEKEMMDWLAKNTKSGFLLGSETTEDDLPYWEINAYLRYDDILIKHADLTECLVRTCEVVLKQNKEGK